MPRLLFKGKKKPAPGRPCGRPGGLVKKKDWRRATFPRASAVSSPLGPLTSVFGMGTGVASPPWPPVKRESTGRDGTFWPGVPRQFTCLLLFSDSLAAARTASGDALRSAGKSGQACRPISTGRLNTLPCLHLRPIYPVVFRGPSTWPPEGGQRGNLVFGLAWRLDAFSAYPVAT